MVVIWLVPHECCNFSACSVYTIQPELRTSLQKKERCFSTVFLLLFFFRFDLTLCLCGHKEVMIMQLISFVVGGGGGVLLLLSV